MQRMPLLNIRELSAGSRSFMVPDEADMISLASGDFVKVSNKYESFWVKLTNAAGNRFEGVVDNDLIATKLHGYALGDLIELVADNIFDYEIHA